MKTRARNVQVEMFLVTQRNPRMTPLQNDPQQQHGATNRKCRVPPAGKRSRDSESTCREFSKSSLASHVGSRKRDVAGRGGGPLPEVLPVLSGIHASGAGGTTTGAPTRPRVRPSPIQCTTETLSANPYRLCRLGNYRDPAIAGAAGAMVGRAP
jgi:hypothetical protein